MIAGRSRNQIELEFSGKGHTSMEEKAASKIDHALDTFKLTVGDPFLERAREISNQIAQRAYDFFEASGFTHGHDRENWILAESEILQPAPVDITETDNEITLRAEVPGFKERELEVHVAPFSICISGERREMGEQKEGKTIISERRARQVYRLLDLPSQVDPNLVIATLSDGVLEIKLSKVGVGKKVPVLAKAAGA